MRRIRYDDAALLDLHEILYWISKDDPAVADGVLEHIVATIEKLGEFSMGRQGRIAGTRDKVVVGLPYIIVYAIDDDDPSDPCLDILTIRHTSRRPLG